jgi:hypothetical protein
MPAPVHPWCGFAEEPENNHVFLTPFSKTENYELADPRIATPDDSAMTKG